MKHNHIIVPQIEVKNVFVQDLKSCFISTYYRLYLFSFPCKEESFMGHIIY